MKSITQLFKKKAKKIAPIVTKKEKRHIETVMEATGWSYDLALSNMTAARDKVGISFYDYAHYKFHAFPVERQEEEYQRICRNKEKARLAREQCYSMIMDYNGCTKDEAIAQFRDAVKRLGITSREYRRYHFFEIPIEEQAQWLDDIRQTAALRKSSRKEKHRKFLDVIMRETGWSEKRAHEEINQSTKLTGATITDYYAFRFWEISPEEQKTYFTQKLSNAISKKYDVDEINRDILLNKELSCRKFGQFMKRPWAITATMTLDEFVEEFKDEKKIVYKPLNGHGGLGIKVLDMDGKDPKALFEELQQLPRGIVEGFVVQHPDMKRMAPASVNTIRIVTVSAKKDNKTFFEDTFDVAYASLRVGSGSSVVDNFSDGGLVAGINLETGQVETPGVNVDCDAFDNHPDSGTPFKGFTIPYFKEAIEMVTEATKLLDGYTGWDIAITEDGPVLIESNIMPGNRILQMPYVPERKGMLHVMEKFL